MKKILIADKDESLKDAFRVVFPSDEYEILFTSNGREIERIIDESRPEIYILNTSLDRKNGIDVYKDLKEKNMLQHIRIFFMRDEGADSNFSDYQIEGVIEKPINFFRVHQMIDKEESLPELKVVKKPEEAATPKAQSSNNPITKEKTNMMENEIKKIISDSMDNMKASIVEKISPLIGKYIEEQTKTILNDTAERVVREEMDKLLNLLRETRK